MSKRNTSRLAKYGLDENGYLKLMEDQKNLCAICEEYETKRSNNGTIQPLSVDHSHRTGKVRALLCNNCNRNIGIAELHRTGAEAIAILRKMISYLSKHAEK